eukprot:2612747-Amphidinium_carterae.1
MVHQSMVCPWELPRAAPAEVAWKTSSHRLMLYRATRTLAVRQLTGHKSQIASSKMATGMGLPDAYRAAMA